MPAGYACTACCCSALHTGDDPPSTTALHRVGAHHCLGGGAQEQVHARSSARTSHFLTADPDDTLDTDDPEHITWLYQKALKRAEEFHIPGVTYTMTQGVVKNIIPAIASTNAIVAASCCNEAFKIATNTNPFLGYPEPGTNNYMMYTGDDSVYTYTFPHQKKDDCPVCGNLARPLEVDPEVTLQAFIESLAERPEAYVLQRDIGRVFTHVIQSAQEAVDTLRGEDSVLPSAAGPGGVDATEPAEEAFGACVQR